MQIEILTKLRDYPVDPKRGSLFTNEGISETEIAQLEQTWNNGNPFPKALKEFLFLAGKYCYLCEILMDSQEEFQQFVRQRMLNNDEIGFVFSRPFYVIDTTPGYGGSNFGFVYLDENEEDPWMHANDGEPCTTEVECDRPLNYTLKEMLHGSIDRLLSGRDLY